MKNWLLIFAFLTAILSMPVRAAESRFTLDGPIAQGGLAIGHIEPGSKVHFAGRDVLVSEDGVFVIGFHRDDPAEMALTVTYPDGQTEKRVLHIKDRDFKIQRIDGLDQKKVTPPKEVLDRIHKEGALVRKARDRDTPETWFAEGFIWPAHGPISGVYGSQRILNGQPRQPHYGVDIAAPEGSTVIAPASGIVSLAYPDMYFSGGTLLLDHGHGVQSGFLHMKSILVKEGQFVKKGEPIGTVGATGRATGPHLDWRINWFNKRIDPQLLVPPMEGEG